MNDMQIQTYGLDREDEGTQTQKFLQGRFYGHKEITPHVERKDEKKFNEEIAKDSSPNPY